MSGTCPWCGQTGGMTLDRVLKARPIGDFSLAGAQMKVSAVERYELACTVCGRSQLGHIEGLRTENGQIVGGHFVADT